MIDETTDLFGLRRPGAERAHAMPLIGRAEECSILAEMLAGCVQGSGHMATVGGHAGVGKTRLAEELRRHSDRTYGDGVTWLWGGAEAHAPRGFQAVRQALGSFLSHRGILPAEMSFDADGDLLPF